MKLTKPSPFIVKAPYLKQTPIDFDPHLFERFIWLDVRHLFADLSVKIKEIEDNSGFRDENNTSLIRVPAVAGSVFGIDPSVIIGYLLEELLTNGSNYDLASILDTIENMFYLDRKDSRYLKYEQISQQFQDLILVHSGGVAKELIRLLSMNGYCNLAVSDYKWQMLGFRMEQALIGYGLIDADGEHQALFYTY